MERARRELLRGRRRERLEERLREARALFESAQFAAAERIVNSALKLLPTHPVALDLFGRMKQRRLHADSVEAQAERELEALARSQARQALAAARAALASGWERKAILALRRGLHLVPDDPDLLRLAEQVQGSQEGLDRERARRRALLSQVRAGIELLSQGDLTASLKILRAVLREEPDNVRAQAAVQEVRRVWLLRRAVAEAAREAEEATAPAVKAPSVTPTPVARPGMAHVRGPAEPPPSRARAGAVPPAVAWTPPRSAPAVRPRGASAPAPQLARSRRGRTPLVYTMAAGGALIALMLVFGGTGRGPAKPGPAPSPSAPAAAANPPQPPLEGPLAGLEPDVARAISDTLAAYARALESADARLLSQVRPDLSEAQRAGLLEPFAGAVNAAIDLRILDVTARGDDVMVVSVRRTDIVVRGGGQGSSGTPVEETLRFQRRGAAWVLR
jgi:tetratricopeptide (TPR) repeat protein